MTRILPSLAWSAVAIGLLACGGSGSVTPVYIVRYQPNDTQMAAAQGVTLADIRSSVFTSDQDKAAIVAAMQERNQGPKLHFALAVPPQRHPYRVVVAFGDPPAGDGDFCKHDDLVGQPSGARTTVVMSFCYGPALLSQVVGVTASARSAGDANLHGLIANALVALLPTDDPTQRGAFSPER